MRLLFFGTFTTLRDWLEDLNWSNLTKFKRLLKFIKKSEIHKNWNLCVVGEGERVNNKKSFKQRNKENYTKIWVNHLIKNGSKS